MVVGKCIQYGIANNNFSTVTDFSALLYSNVFQDLLKYLRRLPLRLNR